ncbi:YdcF family protein [Alkalihalobacillus sp. LMS39]|uniref:YdcF family protein n=1 Tax=Alkalihalobacillus sp. LMS39 TaxID=2924032 RepID=UPI001FB47A55|nr:YdcF family protein [Alkalihalobacillus sp. LMS39]UOE95811.1 YdcF family protein [Alkalihalobacillus sp. LMS39]
MTTTKVKKILLSSIFLLLLWFCIHTTTIVIDGFNDKIEKVDVAVVLGNKVDEDGTPAKRLQARLDKAVELYDEGYFPYIIVSGGTGKEGFDEAEVMKVYLVKQGIPEEVIIEDNQGYNSFMTAENSKTIMDELELHSVMVISQYFHITRTKLAFEKIGFDKADIYSAHADIVEVRDAYSIVREFPAYYKYLLFKNKN